MTHTRKGSQERHKQKSQNRIGFDQILNGEEVTKNSQDGVEFEERAKKDETEVEVTQENSSSKKLKRGRKKLDEKSRDNTHDVNVEKSKTEQNGTKLRERNLGNSKKKERDSEEGVLFVEEMIYYKGGEEKAREDEKGEKFDEEERIKKREMKQKNSFKDNKKDSLKKDKDGTSWKMVEEKFPDPPSRKLNDSINCSSDFQPNSVNFTFGDNLLIKQQKKRKITPVTHQVSIGLGSGGSVKQTIFSNYSVESFGTPKTFSQAIQNLTFSNTNTSYEVSQPEKEQTQKMHFSSFPAQSETFNPSKNQINSQSSKSKEKLKKNSTVSSLGIMDDKDRKEREKGYLSPSGETSNNVVHSKNHTKFPSFLSSESYSLTLDQQVAQKHLPFSSLPPLPPLPVQNFGINSNISDTSNTSNFSPFGPISAFKPYTPKK